MWNLRNSKKLYPTSSQPVTKNGTSKLRLIRGEQDFSLLSAGSFVVKRFVFAASESFSIIREFWMPTREASARSYMLKIWIWKLNGFSPRMIVSSARDYVFFLRSAEFSLNFEVVFFVSQFLEFLPLTFGIQLAVTIRKVYQFYFNHLSWLDYDFSENLALRTSQIRQMSQFGHIQHCPEWLPVSTFPLRIYNPKAF